MILPFYVSLFLMLHLRGILFHAVVEMFTDGEFIFKATHKLLLWKIWCMKIRIQLSFVRMAKR